MTGWRSIGRVSWGWFLAATAVLALLPLGFDTNTMTVLLIWALFALSLGMMWGYAGLLSFGHSAYFGLGAYAYAISAVNMGESTVPLLLAVLVPAACAAVVGAMMFYGRISDVYMGVITLVFTLILFKFMSATAGDAYRIGDARLGGFGGAPKFPHPPALALLALDYPQRTDFTLRAMAAGGLVDQLGGGFYRYSTDAHWSIPHFEKMLYDNGPLLALNAWLYQISADDFFRRVADGMADWALRDMRSPQGAFFSSLDADSEGEEGRFYLWTPDEVRALLTPAEYAVLAPRYGLDQEANFEGHWHLRIWQPLEAIAEKTGQPAAAVGRLLEAGRAKLLAARNRRVWPGRDEKILASWNALMIRGLAIAGRILGREDLIDAASGALDFVHRQMVVAGRLHAGWKDGRARFNAYLDDHAFLLDATLELLQARWDTAQLGFAVWLADELLGRFRDAEHGGFFFTSNDHEALLHRGKPMADEALPAGNAVAALALGRLGHLLGELRYLDAAEATLRAAWPAMAAYPHGHATMIGALDEYLTPPVVVVLRGPDTALPEWRGAAQAVFAPGRLVFAIPDGEAGLPGALATRHSAADGRPLAYVCRGMACEAPVHSLDALGAALVHPG